MCRPGPARNASFHQHDAAQPDVFAALLMTAGCVGAGTVAFFAGRARRRPLSGFALTPASRSPGAVGSAVPPGLFAGRKPAPRNSREERCCCRTNDAGLSRSGVGTDGPGQEWSVDRAVAEA